ncbi:MAG: hypothetical protein J6Z36_04290 [Clostridia bacterium]|nr:hypothetical protein [Clostridia bacterium]
MKKFLLALVSAVMLVAMALSFASCVSSSDKEGTVQQHIEYDVKYKLSDKNYYIFHEDGTGIYRYYDPITKSDYASYTVSFIYSQTDAETICYLGTSVEYDVSYTTVSVPPTSYRGLLNVYYDFIVKNDNGDNIVYFNEKFFNKATKIMKENEK